uniref:Uncharacterized protein n=1 Tax=Arundo donax TaxID=35708 RepID=A0A0A9DBM5_ARUDO
MALNYVLIHRPEIVDLFPITSISEGNAFNLKIQTALFFLGSCFKTCVCSFPLNMALNYVLIHRPEIIDLFPITSMSKGNTFSLKIQTALFINQISTFI